MGATIPIRGWALYDDSCGFCRRFIEYFKPTLRRRGFEPAPLQSPWVPEKISLPADQLLHDFRLLLADGRQLTGANAYRFMMARIWWLYPLYVASIVPGLRQIFDWAYRAFADNRYHISRSCGLSR